jgi:hypothetical protein
MERLFPIIKRSRKVAHVRSGQRETILPYQATLQKFKADRAQTGCAKWPLWIALRSAPKYFYVGSSVKL